MDACLADDARRNVTSNGQCVWHVEETSSPAHGQRVPLTLSTWQRRMAGDLVLSHQLLQAVEARPWKAI